MQKRKNFLMISLFGLVALSSAAMASNLLGSVNAIATNKGDVVTSSILFTRDESFKSIGTNLYSVKSKTQTGQDIYAIIDCEASIGSGYIASFSGRIDALKSTEIRFAYDESGLAPATFQNVTGLKMQSNGSVNLCVASFTHGDYVYGEPVAFTSGTKVDIANPSGRELRIKEAEKEQRTSFNRSMSSLEVFYTCEVGRKVEKFSLSSSAEHGTVNLPLAEAAQSDFISFTVTPDDGYQLSEIYYNDHQEFEIVGGQYCFDMPACDVTVYAEFIEKETPSFDPYLALEKSTISGTYSDGIKTAEFAFTKNGKGTQAIHNGSNTYTFSFDYAVSMTDSSTGQITFSNVAKTGSMDNWLSVKNATSTVVGFDLTRGVANSFRMQVHSSMYGDSTFEM